MDLSEDEREQGEYKEYSVSEQVVQGLHEDRIQECLERDRYNTGARSYSPLRGVILISLGGLGKVS